MGRTDQDDSTGAQMAWGLSGHHDPGTACGHVLEQLGQRLAGRRPTFALVFLSRYQPTAFEAVVGRIGGALGIDAVAGMSAGGIIGGRTTIEDRPGVSVLVGAFDGAEARPFVAPPHAVPLDDGEPFDEWARSLIRADDAHRGSIIFADPSTLAVSRLAPSLYRAGNGRPLLGALTGSPDAAGGRDREPALLCARGHAQRGGLVGLTLSGTIGMETIVAQACRPVGPPMVVTKSHRNLIRELGGKPAIEAVQAVAHEFSPEDRQLLAGGLYIGVAVDEYRERFGRGDFIVRRVLGGHGASGSIAIDEPIRPGRTVQVHLLDPGLARDDLGLLLDGQKLYGTPAGALILTDSTRGRSMFHDEWSDATAVARAFDHALAGEDAAKGGYEIAGIGGSIPVAGCLAPGQIAPIGGSCRVHSTAAGIAIFRGVPAGVSPDPG